MWFFCIRLICLAHFSTGEPLEWSPELLEKISEHFHGFLAFTETRATGTE